MIGYRVPTEAKYSMYVFEVVGFLPDDNGPAIVLPDDFVTQTGSDFDMDTVYALLYNLRRSTKTENVDGVNVTTTKIDIVPFEEKSLSSKVEAIMRDREQLIHVLSTNMDNSELYDTIETLNILMNEYLNATEFIKEHNANDLAQIALLDNIIKTSKGKDRKNASLEKYELQSKLYSTAANTKGDLSNETFLHFSQKAEYKEIVSKVTEIIKDWDTINQNTRKARENRMLDIYQTILTDVQHYAETIAVSNFKDSINSGKLVDDKLNKTERKINNLTFDGQREYREKSHQGRSLKSISIALDRFNSIAQVAKIQLTDKLNDDDNKISKIVTLPVIKYEIPLKEKSRIKRDYKDDAIFTSENGKEYVTITHRFIGNNPNGTFKNVINKFINSYSAQTTAHVLDNVAHPLANNINEYTVNIWKMLISLGSTFDISSTFVNQPIIRELTEFFFNHLNDVKRGNEIETIKRKYQTLLYRSIVKRGGKANEYWDNDISEDKSIFIGGSDAQRKRQYDYLGYSNNTGVTIDLDKLINNINAVTLVDNEFPELETELAKKDANIDRVKEMEEFLRYQLQILETFKQYKTYSDAITDGSNILNIDSVGAGPTFDTTTRIDYNIKRANAQGILEIDGISAMLKIFPRLFGRKENSVYPVMEQFYIFSNLLSHKAFKEHFIGQSDLYQQIKRDINALVTSRKYDTETATKVTKYLNNLLLNDHPWLNDLSETEKHNLLGIDNEINLTLDLKDPNSLIEFETLSVANQIKLLLTDRTYPTDHIMNHLETSLQKPEIKRNKHHKIEYVNNEMADTITQSFNDLWYSDDILERIVARNLIKYEYLTSGFGFGYTSLSKIIPNTIFALSTDPFMEGSYNEQGIGLSNHLYGKLDLINAIKADSTSLTSEENQLRMAGEHAFKADYMDRFVRANWTNDNIVPDAGGLKYWNKTATNQEGVQGVWMRYFQVDKETGTITIPAETMNKITTGKVSNNVKEKNVIKLSSNVKGETKWTLYKRTDAYVDVNEETKKLEGTFYYYPVNKLEFSENNDFSVFPENNQLPDGSEIQPIGDYLGMIEKLNLKRNIDNLIFGTIAVNAEKIRNGEQSAFTVMGDRAEYWSTLKVGDLVAIADTKEYVKVTKPLTNINLTTLAARKAWSERNQLPHERLHEKVDGVAYSDRTDIFEFEFLYIGTLEDAMKDANASFGEGEVNEDSENNNQDIKAASYTSSTNQGVNNAISSADDFIKKVYGNLVNRVQIYKKYNTSSGTLKDTVEAMSKLGVQRDLVNSDLVNLAEALKLILKQTNYDLTAPKVDKFRGGIAVRLQEYENMDINTIINDPIIRKEFTDFMPRVLSFLKGVTTFDILESIDGDEYTLEEKVINDLIKELQNLTPAIKNTKAKFEKLYDTFIEADLIDFTKNPDIVAGLRKILDPGDDESFIQLQLDALADTNNSFTALMVKRYMVNMNNADDDATKEIGEYEAILKKTFGKSVTSLTESDFIKYLEVKNGKRTGKLIQKYDWDKFYADRKAYFDYALKTYGKGTDNYINYVRAWYKNNEQRNITDEELEIIVRKKQEELSQSEFEQWKFRNFREIDGRTIFKIGDSAFATPTDKYLNSKWVAIKDDVVYQKLVEIISKYTDYFGKATILNQGFIPSMSNGEKERLTIAEKVEHGLQQINICY